MKKLSMVAALAVTLVALPSVSAYADASKNGCEHSDGKAAGCSNDTAQDPVSVPEPTSFALLTVGLLVCGGAAVVFGRKQLVQN